MISSDKLLVLLWIVSSMHEILGTNVQVSLFPRIPLNLTEKQHWLLKERSKFFEQQSLINAGAGVSVKSKVECGLPNKPRRTRIVGGKMSGAHEFPWNVRLITCEKDETEFFGCGGSLISDQWVLTAAHCLVGVEMAYISLGSHYSDIGAQIDPEGIVSDANSFQFHPDWNSETYAGDIALIKLPTPISFDNKIRPVCLPSHKESKHIHDPVIVSGWGRVSDVNLKPSHVLMKATTNVISNANCSKVYGKHITDHHLCTRDLEGRAGACEGDSGGPLTFVRKNGRHVQLGIVSFGSTKCELGYPDAYTRLSSYVDWIKNVTTSASTSVRVHIRLYFLCPIIVLISFILS